MEVQAQACSSELRARIHNLDNLFHYLRNYLIWCALLL